MLPSVTKSPLPIEAYMRATEEKIRQQKRRLKNEKRRFKESKMSIRKERERFIEYQKMERSPVRRRKMRKKKKPKDERKQKEKKHNTQFDIIKKKLPEATVKEVGAP